MAEVKQDPSLVEVSELIAEHGTTLPPSRLTLSNQFSGQFLITSIIVAVTAGFIYFCKVILHSVPVYPGPVLCLCGVAHGAR